MKIIAKASKNQFLVSMTSDEFANVAGHHSDWTEVYIGSNKMKIVELPVGTEFNVSEQYMQSNDVLSAYKESKTKIESLKNQMTRLLKIMSDGVPFIKTDEEKKD